LKSIGRVDKLDLVLQTRGGDTNAVWPLVSILREFTSNLSVLVPLRAHSAGTLIAFGANRIVMGAMGELSPIDPTTANQFNPTEEVEPGRKAPLGISVEDVAAYFDLAVEALSGLHRGADDDKENSKPKAPADAEKKQVRTQAFSRLSEVVHPLAL